MSGAPRTGYVTPVSIKISYLAGFLVYSVVAMREIQDHVDNTTLLPLLFWLASFLVLYIVSPLFISRFRWFQSAYYLAQCGVIAAIILLPPHEDMWALLFITLSFQVVHYSPPREALAWIGFFILLTITGLVATMGWITGLSRSVSMITGGALLISFDVQYNQIEAARRKSQELLEELQAAHEKLKEYASQAQEHAAAQERDRLAHELHDSVSQMIFSITLNAQATSLLMEKDPSRVPEQLDRLQELTSASLSRMRSLISQWRPA